MAAPSSSPPFYSVSTTDLRPLVERAQPVQKVMQTGGTYRPSPALETATNVALLLGMPLLLTGAPGVGKTRLASDLAERQRAPFEKFVVTSSAMSRDLLYAFDELARMRDAYRERQEGGGAVSDLRRYLRFNALGRAILRACGPEAELQVSASSARGGVEEASFSPVWLRLGERRPMDAPPPCVADIFDAVADAAALKMGGRDASHPTVVLIDEIDKAPREFPNDLLDEIDRFEFAIPELGLRVVPPAHAPNPVVVVTSNREAPLPDAFLRRCCYHHIEFPEPGELAAIVALHLENHDREFTDGSRWLPERPAPRALREQGLRLAMALREPGRLLRPPGLTEIIQWAILVERRLGAALPERAMEDPEGRAMLRGTLGVLLKAQEDLSEASDVLDGLFAAKG